MKEYLRLREIRNLRKYLIIRIFIVNNKDRKKDNIGIYQRK